MDLGSLLIISSVAQSRPFQPFGFPTWVFKPLVKKGPKRLTSYFWALWTNEFSNRESCSEQTNAGARNQLCALPIGSEGRIAPEIWRRSLEWTQLSFSKPSDELWSNAKRPSSLQASTSGVKVQKVERQTLCQVSCYIICFKGNQGGVTQNGPPLSCL